MEMKSLKFASINTIVLKMAEDVKATTTKYSYFKIGKYQKMNGIL